MIMQELSTCQNYWICDIITLSHQKYIKTKDFDKKQESEMQN